MFNSCNKCGEPCSVKPIHGYKVDCEYKKECTMECPYKKSCDYDYNEYFDYNCKSKKEYEPVCKPTCKSMFKSCYEPSYKPTCEMTCEPTCEVTCEPMCESSCKPTCKPACETKCKPTCKPVCKPACKQVCESSCKSSCKPMCESKCRPVCEPKCKPACKPVCEPKCKPVCEPSCKPVCKPACNWEGDCSCKKSCTPECGCPDTFVSCKSYEMAMQRAACQQFYRALECYDGIQALAHCEWGHALSNLEDAIVCLEDARKYNCKAAEIGKMVDCLLDKFEEGQNFCCCGCKCECECKEETCCDRMREEYRMLQDELRQLEDEAMNHTQEATAVLEGLKRCHCKINQLREEMACKCYPKC